MIVPVLLATFALLACDEIRACPQLYCSDGITVEVTPPLETPGTYFVELSADSIQERCTFDLSADSEHWRNCSSHISVHANDGKMTELGVDGAPTQLVLSVKRGETVLRHLKATPSYRSYRPNGKGCDPTCRVAQAVVKPPTLR